MIKRFYPNQLFLPFLFFFAFFSLALFCVSSFFDVQAQTQTPLTVTNNPINEDNRTAYRAIFTWALPKSAHVDTLDRFTLFIDDKPFFDQISNQEVETSTYSLLIDNSSQQYQLIFESNFSLGDHTWQVFGYQADDQLLFTSTSNIFTVDQTQVSLPVIANSYSTQFKQALFTTFTRLSFFVTTVASSIFIILFVLFLFLDFITSKTLDHFLKKIFFPDTKVFLAGFVFDTASNNGVPFVRLTFSSLKKDAANNPLIEETVVSDVDGLYQAVHLPVGKYLVKAVRPGYLFPSQKNRPDFTTTADFYQGETLLVRQNNQALHPQVPLDPIVNARHQFSWLSFRSQFWRTWINLQQHQSILESVLFCLSLWQLYLHPSWLFIFISLFYALLLLNRLFQQLRPPSLQGLVIDQDGQPLANAIVELYNNTTRQLLGVQLSNSHGRFQFSLRPDTYYLSVKKNGYINKNDLLTQDETAKVTFIKKSLHPILEMQIAPTLTQDYFFEKTPDQSK